VETVEGRGNPPAQFLGELTSAREALGMGRFSIAKLATELGQACFES